MQLLFTLQFTLKNDEVRAASLLPNVIAQFQSFVRCSWPAPFCVQPEPESGALIHNDEDAASWRSTSSLGIIKMSYNTIKGVTNGRPQSHLSAEITQSRSLGVRRL